jgi:hypothetical protein
MVRVLLQEDNSTYGRSFQNLGRGRTEVPGYLGEYLHVDICSTNIRKLITINVAMLFEF